MKAPEETRDAFKQLKERVITCADANNSLTQMKITDTLREGHHVLRAGRRSQQISLLMDGMAPVQNEA